MSNKREGKVLFVTGAGRGMGTDIVKQPLTAGYRVAATGRNPATVTEAIETSENLLVAKLDVTQR
jgi:NADP-dependent 3-hydroxy acid dehydrogenase YdfG